MNLRFENVTMRYGQQSALDDFSLSVDKVRCVALIGPSGGGKSTTLRLLAGLEIPSSGSIQINGTEIGLSEPQRLAYRKRIGVVFQAFNLFPHFDALTNVALPLEKVHGYSLSASIEKAESILDQFQLSEHRFKKPAELSGGQNQRVAIARALAPDPDTIFLDEPTSALDPEMTAEVLDAIEKLIEAQKDLVIATHQMGLARHAADQIAIIAEGKLVETGPAAQVIENPQSPRSQKFLGACLNF
ncbi:MAG: amino acid ABC transporter ATP-binding protein [Opitutales bacterium]|jgi:polar amino acid transport system ATP-binding protein|nr:amino acid ABC transporter ATP-binding protein [Opitutales bacterium]MBT5814667.1 amino acid ABC transporter ATP-binding protein [Opitutales bacterium]MDG2254397.1 amino acid ABC transporter ATP-binding protein [Opitutaceae bacterium]